MKKILKNSIWKNLALLLFGIFIIIFGISILWISSFRIPDFHSINNIKISNSTKIYDRTGEILLYDIHQDVKRTDIPFENMGSNIKNATVAIEDSEFYNHKGIRITSIIRATIWAKLTGKKLTGGSTITQQLVKNTLLNSKKTIGRKIKEWALAIKVDQTLPKEKILEYYLNGNPYGGNIYGIEEASKTYFGKNAENITLAEASYLAAIPQSPTLLSPYGKNKDKLEARKNLVLSRMLELKFISKEQFDQAKKEQVVFIPQQTGGIKAPHFVFFIKDYLEKKYGEDMLINGGLKVTTTLNYDLQQKGEQIVKEGALQNEKDWDGKNASLIAIDPKTGQILTMVGSRDYFDKNIDGNFNIATANRQPGSSFKPFIYATAFNQGFLPETVLFDLPTEFQTTCNAWGKALSGHNQDECYMPENYDGKYRGPMSLRNALAQSINIPAVKLFYLVGLQNALKTAEEMGIGTLTDINRYGLTLVIGGGEVTLLDITSSYGVFANNGIKNSPTGILKIEDKNKKIVEEFVLNEKEVLPKNTALMISDVLSDNNARTPTFGVNSILNIPKKEVAVKTGTTNNNKDAWTVGYTPSVAVGVWAGNNDNKPMKKGGAALAGPIWNKFMNEALNIMPNEKFEKPNLIIDAEKTKPVLRGFWQGNENYFIDKISGKLATINTPKETKQEKIITNVHSILYWVERGNITGNPPANPNENFQFNNWEIPIQNWWSLNKSKYQINTGAEKPVEFDDVHTELFKPSVKIIEPNETNTYSPNQKIQLVIESLGHFPLQKMDIFINNIFIETINPNSFFSFTPSELNNLKEENELKIISYDSVFNRAETNTIFKITQ